MSGAVITRPIVPAENSRVDTICVRRLYENSTGGKQLTHSIQNCERVFHVLNQVEHQDQIELFFAGELFDSTAEILVSVDVRCRLCAWIEIDNLRETDARVKLSDPRKLTAGSTANV
jgi:hypothetical protein